MEEIKEVYEFLGTQKGYGKKEEELNEQGNFTEAADLYERRLSEEVRLAGKYLTNRYSPGYGDLPLEVQKPLLEYLNAGRAIGLTLTATNLMVPRKSVTAILGISDRPRPLVLGGCSHCPLLTKCSWRERGERCYEEKKDQSL